MTKEEIAKYAYEVTHAPNKTIITFNNGTKMYGYFDINMPNSEMYHQNKWNFVIVPQENNLRKPTEFNGNDFSNIIL